MKSLPILCGSCNNSKTRRNAKGEITGYSCFGNSMQRARKEKQCLGYSQDKNQTLLIDIPDEVKKMNGFDEVWSNYQKYLKE